MAVVADYAEYAAQWVHQDNLPSGRTPENTSSGASYKATWECPAGHQWKATVYSRILGQKGCPYCSGAKVLAGFNDLATTHPDLADEWHPTLNVEEAVTAISRGSKKKVWWLGASCGHTWLMSVKSRTIFKRGCSFCSRSILIGHNDLATTHPEVAELWHATRNTDIPLVAVSAGSDVLAWWQCKQGHEWVARISNLTAGKRCPYCAGTKVFPGFNDFQDSDLLAEWDFIKNEQPPSTYTSGSGEKVWWKCSNSHSWRARICDRTGKLQRGCRRCHTAASLAEQAIYDWLTTFVQVEQHIRSVVSPHELDMYIPSRSIAVEYNGVYWHSEAAGKNSHYHSNKWKACKEKGIQLIQVWEDEWNRNPEQVKHMLAHKLGIQLPGERRVMARKTQVTVLSKQQAEVFLDEHHVQGYAAGSYYLGLTEAGDIDSLVAVLVLKKEAGTEGKVLNIIRYATSAIVPGGFTKLLKHAERTYQPESFITFSDHCVSDGGLYRNNGFVVDKELPPDYMYVVRGERKHKFGYRLKRFRDDPALQYEDGLTERQLARLNGLPRIWDAGKTRWVKLCDFPRNTDTMDTWQTTTHPQKSSSSKHSPHGTASERTCGPSAHATSKRSTASNAKDSSTTSQAL